MFKQKLTFKNSRGLKLAAIFEGEDKNAPVVIICHGFGSTKDSISYKNLVPKLLGRGLSVFLFDFTGCGQSEGSLSDLIPSAGLDDLESAVKNFNLSNFGLCGTSFGGYVSLLYAFKNKIKALTLKSPVSDWRKIGWPNTEHANKSKDKILADVKDIDIYQQAKNLSIPTLIVHGDKDDVVPIDQSKKLYQTLKGEKRLEIIHSATHDIKADPAHLEKTNTLFADFFKENLLK